MNHILLMVRKLGPATLALATMAALPWLLFANGKGVLAEGSPLSVLGVGLIGLGMAKHAHDKEAAARNAPKPVPAEALSDRDGRE